MYQNELILKDVFVVYLFCFQVVVFEGGVGEEAKMSAQNLNNGNV